MFDRDYGALESFARNRTFCFFQITDLIHSRAAFWPVNSLRGALARSHARTLATTRVHVPAPRRCLDSRPNKLVHVRIPLKKLNVRFMQAERARTMTGWLRRVSREARGFCVYRSGRRTSGSDRDMSAKRIQIHRNKQTSIKAVLSFLLDSEN